MTAVDHDTTCASCGAPLSASRVEGLCPGCLLRAGMPQAAEAETLARLLPQYEIFECIGRGGMGAVHRARQKSLHREVAIKLLAQEVVERPGFIERFEREARALAILNHPNIVVVHDFGSVEGHVYLVMEYVDGVNLRHLMRQKQLTPEQALALVPQICEALQYAHERGVVHRDIKPENILLDKDGRVKIADFGLAKLMNLEPDARTLTASHQVMGTPRYMSPEQAEGSPIIDHRADIYSLGLVFYEMLTGELPMGRFEPPSELVDLDSRLDDVVLKSLAKSPDRRYQHASEVKTAIEHIDREPPIAPDTSGTTLEGEEAENMLWACLCLIMPVLAYMGAVWAESWWPLAALFLPGAGIGSYYPSKTLDHSAQIFVALTFLMSMGALIGVMWALESASPLFALMLFVGGLASGSEEERERLRKKAKEEKKRRKQNKERAANA